MKNNLQKPNALLLKRILCLLLIMVMTGSALLAQELAANQTFQDHDWQSRKVALKEMLTALESEYKVEFAFDDRIVADKFVPSDQVHSKNLEATLTSILVPLQLQHKKINEEYYVILKSEGKKQEIRKVEKKPAGYASPDDGSSRSGYLTTLSSNGAGFAKPMEKTITGQVTDENNEHLPGVNIVVQNTTVGTVTDIEGSYRLNVPDDATTLVFSSVGYVTEEVSISGRTVVNVQMVPDIQALSEIVVVGYGTQSKLTMTAATSTVKGEELSGVPTPTVSSRIQGMLPGVSVQTISGQPGQDLQIRVRGGSSINKSNDPLVIIDGFQRSMNDINPEDIESIDVLKDAAATAIYGARASNGVILITTKRGDAGKTQLDFKVSHGWQEFNRQYDMLSAREYLEWWRPRVATSKYGPEIGQEAPPIYAGNDENSTWTTRFLEDGESIPSGWESMEDPVTGRTLIFQDNNLQDILYRTATQANYNLSATGGNETTKFAASIGYTDQNGIAIGTEYERMNGRVNLDFNLSEKLSFGINADASYSKTNRFEDEEDIFGRGTYNAPTIRREFEDGTPGWGTNGTLANPAWVIATRDNDRSRLIGTFGINGSWSIFEDLTLRGNTFFQLNLATWDYFEKAHFFSELRQAEATRNIRTSRQSELLLEYDKSFNAVHHLNFLMGYSDLYIKDDDAGLEANGAPSDNIPTLNAAPTKLDASTIRSDERLISLFGRFNYDFKHKYLLSMSLRRDGSSKFGSGNKFGYFPSVSAGWVISEENFFPQSQLLNFFKIRGSFGLTGNNSIGRFIAQGEYAPGYNYAGNAGVVPVEMPNSALSWEKTRQTDIGVDFSLFDGGRVDISADWYQRLTEDLLFNVQLSRESGYNSIEQNVGSVEYRGFELSISSLNITNNDFTWRSNFNFAYNVNEVKKLPLREGVEKNRINGTILPDGSGFGGIAEGERLNSITGYQVDFLIDNQEQADNALYDELANGYDPNTGELVGRGTKFPGDFEWMDRNGDGRITDLDQFVLGYADPTTTGGFTNTFSYKNLSLNVQLVFATGHTILNMHRAWIDGNNARRLATTTDVLNAWTEPGDAATTNQPRSDYHDFQHQSNISPVRPSDFQASKGDYLNIRNVSLSYNIPSKILKDKLREVEIFATGNNLHYFTNYRGPNPERGGEYRYGKYPPFRMFTLGARIGL